MDWIRGLQRAIDYMEANITEDLDYAQIVEQAYFESYPDGDNQDKNYYSEIWIPVKKKVE